MTSSTTPEDTPGYPQLLQALRDRIVTTRLSAALSVNRALIELYWQIGRDILDRQQIEGWGTRVIDRLAHDLRRSFPEMTGLSARNLKYMRSFAEAYPDPSIVQQLVAQLPWGHNLRLIESVKDANERIWYARQAIEHGWSRNVLTHQIDSALFRRTGKAMTNFQRTMPAPESELAQQVLKDPYNFEFLGLGSAASERELERGLLANLRAVILELGKGFAFVSSQYPLAVGDQDYFLDLLFYHLKLRCFVVIELKIEDFKPEFAGKMNFYLSAVDDLLRHPDDAPSIGIILCRYRNEVIAEYALRDSTKPMGVAEYRTLPEPLRAALPTAVEITTEMPLLSLLQLRIDIEQAIRTIMDIQGLKARRGRALPSLPEGIDLGASGREDFERIRSALNKAAHGVPLKAEETNEALTSGTELLDELRRLIDLTDGD